MKEANRPIWAPWRINFIRSEKDGECFLCLDQKSWENDIENLIIAREENCFIILNRYPYNSGHLMISPYRHIGDIDLMTIQERQEMMDLTIKAKQTLDQVMQPEGFNVGFNLGSAAGAGVKDHIHMHVVPRWVGDTNFMPVIGETNVVPEALEQTAELLRKAWEKLRKTPRF